MLEPATPDKEEKAGASQKHKAAFITSLLCEPHLLTKETPEHHQKERKVMYVFFFLSEIFM